jgi:hypothetical protein
MASDYERIRADNIRDYGEKTHHLAFLGRLYTDRTHFIFELLQNAEDKNASKVLFQLFEDRLEVKHDGIIFDDRDVRGVCGVGEGTKADDLTKIGKFGIGFKAVYAYTSMPEVHSGDEHFRIEHYVRPSQAPTKNPGEGWTTLFVFWFETSKLPQETASREIAARLRGLTARTLLFLREIKEIEYVLPDETRGIYLREEIAGTNSRQVTVIGESGGKADEERWLVFDKPVPVPERDESVSVEIGFKLETGGKDQTEGIVKIKESPLYVFFPTEKQTNFGFLIQGPYRTTPARDNIPKDDDWNSTLVGATADLIVEALEHIKERGLLTVAVLNALPIRTEDFPKGGMFVPIVTAVHDALKNGELLPADDGTYVSAPNAKLGRGADLRALLGRDQLASLYPSPQETKWLTGDITADRTPDLRTFLLNELKVEELDPDGFARKISRSFLLGQTDEWFIAFYRYLSDQEALWRAPRWQGDTGVGILRSKPILRLQDDRLESPFQADGKANAYLPPPEGTDLPVVKKQIVDDQHAAAFLKRLGLSEPDIFDDIVDRVLPKYARSPAISISAEDHAADIQKIFRALASDSEAGKRKVLNAAQVTPFLRAANLNGQTSFKKPGEIYCDAPDLRIYFEKSEDAWFVDEAFSDAPPSDDVWDALGVARLPRRIMFAGELPAGIREYSRHPQTIENYKLDGFQDYMECLNANEDFDDRKKRTLILWRYLESLLQKDRYFFSGHYAWFYYSHQSKRFDSYMLTHLRESDWIPAQDRTLRKPVALAVRGLPEEFRDADELIKLLGISADDQTEEHKKLQHASELGVPLEDIEFLKQHADDFQKWKSLISQTANRPAFPVRASSDAARRQDRLSEQWRESQEKEYDHRDRSVRTTRTEIDPRYWLKSWYTNDDGQMICQLCADEMPFKKRDGEYYFEAVEALGAELFSKEHEAQFLALCPTCAAKYKEYVKADENALAALKQSLLDSDGPDISIVIENASTILRFVEVHFIDLKTILNEEVSGTV